MEIGGTERQLAALISGLDGSRFKPYVVTLRANGTCFDLPCEQFLFPTVKLFSPNGLVKLLRMASLLRRERIRIVQTFFFDATCMGVVAARLAGVPAIISSRRDVGFWHTPFKLRMMRILNRLTHRIVANSESVRQNTVQKENVSPDRVDVIHNGIAPASFEEKTVPGEAKRALGLDPAHPIVGIVANLNREVKRLDVFIH